MFEFLHDYVDYFSTIVEAQQTVVIWPRFAVVRPFIAHVTVVVVFAFIVLAVVVVAVAVTFAVA